MKKLILVLAVLLVMASSQLALGSLVIGNTAGGVWIRTEGLDSEPVIASGAGYGTVSAMASTASGNIVIANGEGTVRLRHGANLVSMAIGQNYGTIGDVATMSNGNIIIGNTAGGVWVRTDGLDSEPVVTHGTGYGNITAIDVLSNDNVVIADQGGVVRLRHGANLASIAYGQGYGTIGDVAVTANDNVVIGNTAGSVWIRTDGLDSEPVVTQGAGYGIITAIEGLSNGNVVIANSGGEIRVRNGLNLAPVAYGSGYGNIVGIDVTYDGKILVGNSAGGVYLLGVSGGGLTTLASGANYSTIGDVAVLVPEPATIAILGLGALVLRRRKR